MMIHRNLPKIAAAAIALSGAAVLAAIVAPALAQNLPNGNGKELVETICASCHDLSPITDTGFSREDWETVVKSMIDMGAPIKPDQVAVIATYLATNFPPKPKQ
jgi:virginiamycin B lyase